MLRLSPSSPLPPYEQVRRQLAEQVASGALVAGTRLPAVRRLAADLGVAPGTIARAYRELEQAGIVVTNRRTGTVVAPHEGMSGVDSLSREHVSRLRALGVDDDGIRAALERALS